MGILSDQSRQGKYVLSVSDLHKTGQANFQGEKQNKIDFHLTVKSTPLSALTLALTLQHALPGDADICVRDTESPAFLNVNSLKLNKI